MALHQPLWHPVISHACSYSPIFSGASLLLLPLPTHWLSVTVPESPQGNPTCSTGPVSAPMAPLPSSPQVPSPNPRELQSLACPQLPGFYPNVSFHLDWSFWLNPCPAYLSSSSENLLDGPALSRLHSPRAPSPWLMCHRLVTAALLSLVSEVLSPGPIVVCHEAGIREGSDPRATSGKDSPSSPGNIQQ